MERSTKYITNLASVFSNLFTNFLESVYEEALYITLEANDFKVEQQVQIPVWFRGGKIGHFEADLIVESFVILELKAVQTIVDAHKAQLLNYLRATDVEVGLILNFGQKPEFRRMVFDNGRKLANQNP